MARGTVPGSRLLAKLQNCHPIKRLPSRRFPPSHATPLVPRPWTLVAQVVEVFVILGKHDFIVSSGNA